LEKVITERNAHDFISKILDNDFYGNIIISIKGKNIMAVRKEQTAVTPEQLEKI